MWPIIAGVIAAVVLLFIIFVAMQPADVRITRSAKMSAPPQAVFAQVNDFHKWTAWSPWEKLDRNLKRTYEGSPAGAGSVYSWSGNKKVGEGRMTLVESYPSDLIRIKLEFFKPFKATNQTDFTFQPQGSDTLVTWTMTGKNNFMAKAFCMFMNMDKLVGGDFEKGLTALKSIVERSPATQPV